MLHSHVNTFYGLFMLFSLCVLCIELCVGLSPSLSKVLKNLFIRRLHQGGNHPPLPFFSTVDSDNCTKLITISRTCGGIP